MNMDNITIYIIIGMAVVLVAALIAVLITLKKKNGRNNQRKLILESRELISSNAAAIGVLLELAKDNAEMTETLKLVQDKIKYLTPSASDEVKKIDQKITSIIGDIKIELSKKKSEESEKAQRYIDDIGVKIAERGVYTQR